MDYIDNSVIKNKFKLALEKKNIPVIEFMVNEQLIDNFDIKTMNNENVLHVLCKNSHLLENKQKIFSNLLPITKKIINEQDINGNTPIINAIGGGNNELCNMLEEHGADRHIRNNEGFYVSNIDSENSNISINNSINEDKHINYNKEFQVSNINSDNTDIFSLNSEGFTSSNSFINKKNTSYTKINNIPTTKTKTMSNILTPKTTYESNNFINAFKTKPQNKFISDNTDSLNSLDMNTSQNSSAYFDDLINKIKSNTDLTNNKLDGGFKCDKQVINKQSINKGLDVNRNLSTTEVSVDTDKILNLIVNTQEKNNNNQSGGILTGKRMLKQNKVLTSENSYSNSDHSSNSDISESKNKHKSAFSNYARQLGRLIDNQKQQIFERIVNKIMKLLSVDNETARFYKTTLIIMAKRKNPNLTGLDLANEVEKLATTDVLKKINIEDEKKIILKKREERKSSDSQQNTDSSASEKYKHKKLVKTNVNTTSDTSDSPIKSKTKKVTKKVKKSKTEDSMNSSDISGISEISLNDFSVTSLEEKKTHSNDS